MPTTMMMVPPHQIATWIKAFEPEATQIENSNNDDDY
jgi:hypothetical protein